MSRETVLATRHISSTHAHRCAFAARLLAISRHGASYHLRETVGVERLPQHHDGRRETIRKMTRDAIRSLVTRMLQRAGCVTEEARDGEQAIEKIRGDGIAAIVFDPMMPRVSGFDVLEFLRNNAPHRKCVIVLSAAAQHLIDALDDRLIYARFRKPFELERSHRRRTSLHTCMNTSGSRGRSAIPIETITAIPHRHP